MDLDKNFKKLLSNGKKNRGKSGQGQRNSDDRNKDYNHSQKNKNHSGYNQNTQKPLTPINEIKPLSPFHNPYAFIPFPGEKEKPERHEPAYLTAEESDSNRLTGFVDVKLKAETPLKIEHRMNGSVIVPATGVRGALRNLMMIVTGSALTRLDESAWLIQGRDINVGPNSAQKNYKAILGRVEEPGTYGRSGKIRLGETRLVPWDALQKLQGVSDESRQVNEENSKEIWIDNPDDPKSYSSKESQEFSWQIKLSGQPVNQKGIKKEGAFKPGDKLIEIDAKLWEDYLGRHRHAVRKKLEKGDLIWLELKDQSKPFNADNNPIMSLQWARWGRKGVALKDHLPPHLHPCTEDQEGKVDIVADLFGQVRVKESYASRIRPHNLVFEKPSIQKDVELARLYSPHPGCLAFYRNDTAENVNSKSPLAGYKIYRNTKESGNTAPWHYKTQGIYQRGVLKPFDGKKADLLDPGQTGNLRIAFRSLSLLELGLLKICLEKDMSLRLGGGKPLGLGHCVVESVEFKDEIGQNIKEALLADAHKEAREKFEDRLNLFKVSQESVEKLRYPRAANGNTWGGEGWYSVLATHKKRSGEKGLEEVMLNNRSVSGQMLPPIDAKDTQLYGYDWEFIKDSSSNGKNKYTVEMTVEKQTAQEAKGPNLSQNQKSRQQARVEGRTSVTPLPETDFNFDEASAGVAVKAILEGNPSQQEAQKTLDRLATLGINEEKSNKWKEKIQKLLVFLK